MNILDYIPQLYVTGEYSGGPPALRALAMCPYIPRLTEEYIVFLYNPYFGCHPGWRSSKTGFLQQL
jgi:hypothetical protein